MFRIKKTCMCAAVLINNVRRFLAAGTDVRDIVSLQEEALGINERSGGAAGRSAETLRFENDLTDRS